MSTEVKLYRRGHSKYPLLLEVTKTKGFFLWKRSQVSRYITESGIVWMDYVSGYRVDLDLEIWLAREFNRLKVLEDFSAIWPGDHR